MKTLSHKAKLNTLSLSNSIKISLSVLQQTMASESSKKQTSTLRALLAKGLPTAPFPLKQGNVSFTQHSKVRMLCGSLALDIKFPQNREVAEIAICCFISVHLWLRSLDSTPLSLCYNQIKVSCQWHLLGIHVTFSFTAFRFLCHLPLPP